MDTPAPVLPSRRFALPSLAFTGVFIAMAARLVLLIARNEANLLYYDEWDIYRRFMLHASWSDLFFAQPGPHRQGIGYILMSWIAAASRWNTRAMSFAVLAFLVAACLLTLLLKRRLFGSIAFSDAITPLLFLSPIQYENFLGDANLPTTSMPVFFVVLYALAWTLEKQAWRYTWVVIINFFAIYCGYGFFLGLITPALLAIDLLKALRKSEPAAVPIIAMLAALASLASFFIGYRFNPAAGCFRFPIHPLVNYPWFIALMFSNILRIKGHGPLATIVGFALLVITIAIFLRGFQTIWQGNDERKMNRAALSLTAFTLLYAINAAIGRVCFGVEYGQSSRYAPYLFPAFLAFYFALLQLKRAAYRKSLLGIYAALLLIAAVFVSPRDKRTIAYYREGKQAWKQCVLTVHDPASCTQETRFQIYPDPGSFRIRQELDYMEQHQLNLFSPSSQ